MGDGGADAGSQGRIGRGGAVGRERAGERNRGETTLLSSAPAAAVAQTPSANLQSAATRAAAAA